jgi:hypothetical protein
MFNVRTAALGDGMSQMAAEQAKALAQNLVEILTPYEEELIALERDAPAMAQLRRAVGIAMAEACYVISDQVFSPPEWAPPADGSTRSPG